MAAPFLWGLWGLWALWGRRRKAAAYRTQPTLPLIARPSPLFLCLFVFLSPLFLCLFLFLFHLYGNKKGSSLTASAFFV